MSDPKRYSIVADYQAPWAKMHEFSAGGWVKWEDYARLKADYEVIEKHLRFHIEQESLRKAGEVLHQQNIQSGAYNREKNETIERLKAEVERLRKAGDAMAICLCGGTTEDYNKRCALNWLSAKEGKQP